MVEDKELTLRLKSISKYNKWKTGIGELKKMYCIFSVLLYV